MQGIVGQHEGHIAALSLAIDADVSTNINWTHIYLCRLHAAQPDDDDDDDNDDDVKVSKKAQSVTESRQDVPDLLFQVMHHLFVKLTANLSSLGQKQVHSCLALLRMFQSI